MQNRIIELLDEKGQSIFSKWFDKLNSLAAAKVTMAVHRLESGNHSNVKSVGSGVFEYKVDFGPGYRVYFGREGEAIIILIVGGTKNSQQKDIEKAKILWRRYKDRKTEDNNGINKRI